MERVLRPVFEMPKLSLCSGPFPWKSSSATVTTLSSRPERSAVERSVVPLQTQVQKKGSDMSALWLCRVVVAAGLVAPVALAAVSAAVRGVVHDPQHRPIAGATVTLHAAHSDFVENEKTNADGGFNFS